MVTAESEFDVVEVEAEIHHAPCSVTHAGSQVRKNNTLPNLQNQQLISISTNNNNNNNGNGDISDSSNNNNSVDNNGNNNNGNDNNLPVHRDVVRYPNMNRDKVCRFLTKGRCR